MGEMAQVPADWFAVFHAGNLPGHASNPDTDAVVPWPVLGGVEAMPMSGRFLVRDAGGNLTAHEDGFLVIGPDGHPQWQAEAPA